MVMLELIVVLIYIAIQVSVYKGKLSENPQKVLHEPNKAWNCYGWLQRNALSNASTRLFDE